MMQYGDLFSYLGKIQIILEQKAISGYAACIVNSGFGDIVTNASISSIVPQILGLEFKGITSKVACYDDVSNCIKLFPYFWRNRFYADFLKDINFMHFARDEVFIIEVDNVLLDMESLIMQLSKAPRGSIICIAPINLFYTNDYGIFAYQLGIDLYDNGFTQALQKNLSKKGFYDDVDYSPMNICVHQRIGDSGILEINSNGDIISTDWIAREDKYKQYGWYNLKNKKGSQWLYGEYRKNHSLKDFIQKLKLNFHKARIYFISDGFETAHRVLEQHPLAKKHLLGLNISYDSTVARKYGEEFINVIKDLKEVDKVIIGEDYVSFLECIKIILSSHLVFSNRRAYIMRTLLGFKADKSFPQIVCIDGLENGAEFYLQKKNIWTNGALRQEVSNSFLSFNSNIHQKYAYFNLYRESNLKFSMPSFYSASSRIKSHLSYKLGQALILNSKSLWGYIRMPYVLSYIKDKHKQEQKEYQEKIKKNPSLKLPTLESYRDYKDALKIKNTLSYQLGEAFIKAKKQNFFKFPIPYLKANNVNYSGGGGHSMVLFC